MNAFSDPPRHDVRAMIALVAILAVNTMSTTLPAGTALPREITAAAQALDAFEGVWTVKDAFAARKGGGLPMRLTISTQGMAAVTIKKDAYNPETYRLDGSETRLQDSRTATATVQDGALVVTFTRRRVRPDEVPSVVSTQEVYRVTGSTLTLERRARGHAADTAPGPWVVVNAVSYSRE